MRYYIADLHFCHENLNTRMDCRGFESGEAMNEYMIAQWNSRVRKRDEVVILGDFCISKKGEVANAILERLNGKKYLIIGIMIILLRTNNLIHRVLNGLRIIEKSMITIAR